MSFFENFWRRRHLRQTAKDFSEALGKHLRYKKDILREEAYENLANFRQELDSQRRAKNEGALTDLLNRGDRLVAQYLPIDSLDWLREQIEVILVAVVTALAIRAYFYQPFKIPTDSMKPTLYGVQSVHDDGEVPGWLQQRWEQVVFGRLYHHFTLRTDATLIQMREGRTMPIPLWFSWTDLTFSNGETHRVWCSLSDLAKQGIQVGMPFAADDPAFNFYTEAGDQVLVNKWLFNFRLPHRGEVLVFRTTHITGIEARYAKEGDGDHGSEFYIKRCVGLPGDTLQVKSPLLYINGSIQLENEAIKRVEAARNGYRGYGFIEGSAEEHPLYLRTPNDVYTVPPDGFWAMGDNSYDSLDSRFWGIVPRENIVGTGSIVWWPFSKRWGFIQ